MNPESAETASSGRLMSVSPDVPLIPSPRRESRARMYEDGWCTYHDFPTEHLAGGEKCRKCVADLDRALAVLDGARDRRSA